VETQTVTCEINLELYIFRFFRERRVRDRMLVGFLSTYAIGAYQHLSREFEGQIHCEVYSIHSYIITFASDRPLGFFIEGEGGLPFPQPIKWNTTIVLNCCSKWCK